jgi:hypothetical protein
VAKVTLDFIKPTSECFNLQLVPGELGLTALSWLRCPQHRPWNPKQISEDDCGYFGAENGLPLLGENHDCQPEHAI